MARLCDAGGNLKRSLDHRKKSPKGRYRYLPDLVSSTEHVV